MSNLTRQPQQQDLSLFITNEEFRQLDNIIGDIPSRYGFRLANFFNAVRQKRYAEAQLAIEQAKKKTAEGGDGATNNNVGGDANTANKPKTEKNKARTSK